METVQSVRIDHGSVSGSAMAYSQRQPSNHRGGSSELYKPSRSPLAPAPAPARYSYPGGGGGGGGGGGPPASSQQPRYIPAQPPPQQYTYRDYRPPRISLLPPEYSVRPRGDAPAPTSLSTPAASPSHHLHAQGVLHPQQQPSALHSAALQQQQQPGHGETVVLGNQPFKKIRLQEPLRIDTRDQPGSYNPQVEAISPTLPDHHIQEDQAFKTTKDELLQQIGKVDREIAKAESQISILKKKQAELEEIASKPAIKQDVEEVAVPKHQSLAQKIYAENRKKAQAAHSLLDTLGPKVDWPIYNQPSDTTVYHENKRRHQTFKRRLLEYFKKRHTEKESRESYLTQTYSKLMQEWLRKVDKIECSQKRKAKETKNREFFEKVFPELRKQREDKERFNRVGARIKSEADLEEIMDGLQEQEMEDKKMRSYAVIPPILLDARQRKLKYVNNNGHILDMETEYKERQLLNVWTPSENEVFKEKYLQHPKNFGVIASYLDRKSVQDCVQHYYLTKKTENYKQLLRKSRQRTRASRNNPQKVNNAANNSVVDILTTGVTTRLQREQQAKTAQNPTSQSETSVATATTTITTSSMSSASSTSSTVSTTTTTITTTTTAANGTTVLAPTVSQTKMSQAEDKTQTKVVSSNNVIVNTTACSVVVSSPQPVTTEAATQENRELNHDAANSDQSNSGATSGENKKKKERRKDKDSASMETSDDEVTEVQDKSSPGICTVCKSPLGPQLQSRPLPPSQASQYGLREEDIPPGGRVCNTCRCKCVRSRYTHCPVPTCPNARGRVKRLRSLPARWQELPAELRDPIVAEFQIPNGVTKCCSACFNRIQRRLGAQEEWAEVEVNRLKILLSEIGPIWTAVGERLGRPGHQVKAFYSANRKRLGLEACLGDSKPVLTDEEESGSSTSSCEEQPLTRDRHSSDTASAESPPAAPEQPQGPTRKEDYDSSATETADEGQTPDHYQGSATITVVTSDGQPRAGNSSPMTVKDLMSNVIELQLMKNSAATAQAHTPASGMTPTISSILNIDSPDVTIIREYNLNNQPSSNNQNDLNLARLVNPLIGATITPVSAPGPPEQPPQREEVVVLQVQDGRDPEPMTLDLSLKKPREPIPPPAHAKHPMSIHRSEPYIQYHHGRKSPAVYVSTVARTQPKLPSPKPANPKTGSITLGTPIINQQQRYEGLLRQMTPDTKMGSITQGTPIHVPAHMQDKRIYEYYKRQPPQQGTTYPGQYRPPAYAVEQQLSSRQIIMNDYITSQQMHGPRRVEKPPPQQNYYPTGSPHRTPPPQPQRQGVIQRHTRPQPHYPPGHEALSSLVDVAVQQPSLPVPAAPHEGLGKTIVDHLSEPHRFHHLAQMQQQMRHQQRFAEERRAQMAYREHQQQQVNKQHQQQQQQPSRVGDSSTMTAASLIDAIITHQINQPTETGGREVVANSREPPRPGDRLFQSFHREPPQSQNQPENNGDRSPSVISVDLEAEPQNKSMTVKEITDSVINMDFRQPGGYYHQDNVAEQWKRRLQKEEKPRSGTPQTDERQIIRIAQPQQKYQPVSPPENNHWSDGHGHDYRRFAPTQSHPQSHISALDYVKHRIVEVMRTEDDKRDEKDGQHGEKDRSDSPGDMVIDEDKHEVEFQQQPSNFAYAYSALNVPHAQVVATSKESSANENPRPVEPKPLMSAQYEPLSDED